MDRRSPAANSFKPYSLVDRIRTTTRESSSSDEEEGFNNSFKYLRSLNPEPVDDGEDVIHEERLYKYLQNNHTIPIPQFLTPAMVDAQPSMLHVISRDMDIRRHECRLVTGWIAVEFCMLNGPHLYSLSQEVERFRAAYAGQPLDDYSPSYEQEVFIAEKGHFYIDAKTRKEPLPAGTNFHLTVPNYEKRKELSGVELCVSRDGKGNVSMTNTGTESIFVQSRDNSYRAGLPLDTVRELVSRDDATDESQSQLLIFDSENLLNRIEEAKGPKILDNLHSISLQCHTLVSLLYKFGPDEERKTVEDCPFYLKMKFCEPLNKIDAKCSPLVPGIRRYARRPL